MAKELPRYTEYILGELSEMTWPPKVQEALDVLTEEITWQESPMYIKEQEILAKAPTNRPDMNGWKNYEQDRKGLIEFYKQVIAYEKNERKRYLRALRAEILAQVAEVEPGNLVSTFKKEYDKALKTMEYTTGKGFLYPELYPEHGYPITDQQKMDVLEASSIRRTKEYLCQNRYLRVRPIKNQTTEEPLEIFEVTEKGKAYIKNRRRNF